MQRKFLLSLFVLTLMAILLIPQIVQGQMGPPFRMGHPMMEHPMMGQNRGDAQTIHQLFAYSDRIHRTVEEIPGGIRAVTESDSPEVAALIQSHVSLMYDRIAAGRPIPMIGMSATLPTMVRDKGQYQRQLRAISKGVEVTEISDDPEMVATIREHAREVTQFIERGMPAMGHGGMR